MGNHSGSLAQNARAKEPLLRAHKGQPGRRQLPACSGTPTIRPHGSCAAQARSVTLAASQSRSRPRSNGGQMIFISTRPDGGRPPEQAFSNSHANLNPALLARVSPRCLPSPRQRTTSRCMPRSPPGRAGCSRPRAAILVEWSIAGSRAKCAAKETPARRLWGRCPVAGPISPRASQILTAVLRIALMPVPAIRESTSQATVTAETVWLPTRCSARRSEGLAFVPAGEQRKARATWLIPAR